MPSVDKIFLLVWYSSAALSVFLPLTVFSFARILNYAGGDGENEEADQENDNGYNQNQYDQNNQNYQYAQQCRWWQWGCNNNYEAENREEAENNSPWWWLWAEDERRKDPEDRASPTLIVIYVWTILMLLGILYYGHGTISQNGDMTGVAVSLLLFANYSIISMLFLGGLEGAIEDDGRAIEEDGWYGQFGVLMYMSNMFNLAWSLIFFFIVRRLSDDKFTTKVDIGPSDFIAYREPQQKETL